MEERKEGELLLKAERKRKEDIKCNEYGVASNNNFGRVQGVRRCRGLCNYAIIMIIRSFLRAWNVRTQHLQEARKDSKQNMKKLLGMKCRVRE